MKNKTSETEIAIPLRTANVYSFLVFVASFILFGIPFSIIWSLDALLAGWKLFLSEYVVLIVTIIGGMVIHELLHAATWAMFSRNGYRSVQFGINWKHLAPYVHCKEYLSRNRYVAGVIAPGVLLGILPGITSVLTGSTWLLCVGVFFSAGAAGDLVSVIKLLNVSETAQIMDHPEHLGFRVKNDL